MKLEELVKRLDAEVLNAAEPLREIEGGYCGDFLSFVMSRAPGGSAWFTVMSNVNVIAVAVLAEVGAVVLCEGVRPDPAMLEKARSENITVIATKLPAFEAVLRYN